MSLGLPGNRTHDVLTHALNRAVHAAAFVCLAISIFIGVVTATTSDTPEGWPAAGLSLALIGLLWVVDRWPTVTATLAYLVAGTAVVLFVTVIVMARDDLFQNSNNVLLALPRCALLLVGGAGMGSGIAVVWALLGWALGEAAVFIGCLLVGAAWAPSHAAAFALVVVVIARGYDGISLARRRAGEARLRQASRQARDLEVRRGQELLATARLHDTALSHLLAIAAAGSGPVEDRLRAGIRRDFARIIGRNWASDAASATVPAAGADPPGAVGDARRAEGPGRAPGIEGVATGLRPTDVVEAGDGRYSAGGTERPVGTAPVVQGSLRDLPAAFAAAANAGLAVTEAGDFTVIGTLSRDRAEALDAAVAQCLVNVARHAGVGEAQVAVGIGGGEITAAVIDTGRGFDVGAVAADRIGLRVSIRARIEQVGGTVRLWSTKGIGTTVVLTVPLGESGGRAADARRTPTTQVAPDPSVTPGATA